MGGRRRSFFIHSEGPSESAVVSGFKWLRDLRSTDGSSHDGLIAVPVLSNLDDVVTSTIGDKAVRALKADKPVSLGSKISIHLMTERKVPTSWNGPVLAIYPTKRLLDCVDDIANVTDVLVIPWTMEEVQYWINTWNAMELGAETAPSEPRPFSDPVVEAALKSLTQRVNLSTGIHHPSDRAAAIDLFRILLKNGMKFDPEEIRGWLVRRGNWRPQDADDVACIASAILSGKRLKGGRAGWNEKILEIWKKDAGK